MNSKEVFEISLKKHWRGYNVFLILIAFLESVMIVYALNRFDFHSTRRVLYFFSYVFLLSCSLIVLFINTYCMKKGTNTHFAIFNAYFYVTMLVFWSAMISALDIIGGGFTVTYITILAAVGGVMALNPVFFSAISVLSTAFMIVVVMWVGNSALHVPFYLNHVIFLMVMIAVEFRNYNATREQYMLNEKLEELAGKDGLTKVFNRRQLDKYIEQLIEESSCFSFALLDVDNFKSINDTYGHGEGDKCLSCISSVLTGLFGETVFRYGGDEFAVVSFENADNTAAKLNKVNAMLAEKNPDYVLQTCSGVYYSDGNQDERKIFESADNALYEAKHNGKARTVVYNE
ncbi:MAG: GGDEF domain-containing protein [Lachnospira sp.]